MIGETRDLKAGPEGPSDYTRGLFTMPSLQTILAIARSISRFPDTELPSGRPSSKCRDVEITLIATR